MNSQVLKERFDRISNEQSDVMEHIPTFVNAVEELGATRVVELGVRYGVSTIAWMYALEGKGNLWAVDTSFPVPSTPDDINLLDPQGPLGVVPYWIFILGSDTSQQVLDALPQSDIDILFLDTNHVYEETLVELTLYYPRVRSGGRIFLHDTAVEVTGNAVTPQPSFPVLTAMKEFCAEHNLRYENVTNCYGLGTIFC